MFVKILKSLIFIYLLFNKCLLNGSIINQDGDYIFGYFSDLVYDPKILPASGSRESKFMSIGGQCIEWKILIDHSRIMIFQSKLTNNLIISFRGTNDFSDILTDINCIPVQCNITSACYQSKIHRGFLEEYYETNDLLYSTIKSLDQEYDIYFTGHSLGATLALLGALDYTTNHLNEIQFIKSINLITFGSPGVGDYEFNNFMKQYNSKINHRRYVNVNNNTYEQDPVVNTLFTHYNTPILLSCKQCPLFQLGLHSMDLYNGNLFNSKFAECNTNCNFYEKDASIYKYQQHYCPIKAESIIHGMFHPQGKYFPDKYAVCLFTSKMDFDNYSYKASTPCNVLSQPTPLLKGPIVLVDKTTSKVQFEKITTGKELYVVVENHNSVFKTSSFEYNITFTNPIKPPLPPSNLTCSIKNTTGEFICIQVSFTSNNLVHYNSISYQFVTYNIYVSEVGKDWKKFEFIEPGSNKHISKSITNIPKGLYSIVATVDNGLESQTSNFGFIYNNITSVF